MSEHEDIARRLREEGPAPAPPDLADEVMAQVRAEPRRRPRRAPRVPWRPVLGWAAAAVVLVGIGFGIAHLPHGASSSSGSASSAGVSATAGGATNGASSRAPQGLGETARPMQVYTVGRAAGLRILGTLRSSGAARFNAPGSVVTVRVPPAAYRALQDPLARAERRYQDSPNGRRVIIRLIRAGTR